jgi:ABC-type sugar transport system ATPase subunit
MIYVTHDHMDAMMVGSRVAVLRQGVLQQVADPAILYQAPANLFVAGLYRLATMNSFEARSVNEGRGFFRTEQCASGSIRANDTPNLCSQFARRPLAKILSTLGQTDYTGTPARAHGDGSGQSITVGERWTFKAG